jgi:hypothetical protein
MRGAAILLGAVLACGGERAAAPAVAPAPAPTWLKGQLHMHTDRSGDSATPVAAALRWYAGRGFDFVVVTDHNFVTVADGGPVLAVPGAELTQNLERCEPPPSPGQQCLLHVNALFVDAAGAGPQRFAAPATADRRALYGRALARTRELGGLAQLNHPNFHYAADAALIAALVDDGVALLEVANEAIDSNNAGDAAHPSTEALWDATLTAGRRVWAVATDDAHHYDDAARIEAGGETAYVGDRGWVMVRAARDPRAIRAAIERGEFYASNGVRLDDVEVVGGALRVRVATPHAIAFIGPGGATLARTVAAEASHAPPPGGYVRAVVTAPDGRRAWTQPLFD